MGIFSIERVFLITLEMLKGVLHVKNYSFIKSTLVTDGKKELLFGEGAGQKVQRRFLHPASSYAHTRRLVPEFWSKGAEMAAKVAEVRASRRWWRRGEGERWWRWESGSHWGRGTQSALLAAAMNSVHSECFHKW